MTVVLIGSPGEWTRLGRSGARANRQPLIANGQNHRGRVGRAYQHRRYAWSPTTQVRPTSARPWHADAGNLWTDKSADDLSVVAQAEIIRHPPDCAPCMLRDCPIDHRCMTAISVEEVFQRAMAMIEHFRPGIWMNVQGFRGRRVNTCFNARRRDHCDTIRRTRGDRFSRTIR